MATRDTLDLLIVDDDEELNALLTEYFQGFGHTLRSATTAAAGHQQLRRALPDLLILDIMLPDTDGLTLCRELREEYDVPIIMLTARGEIADRVMGLELGADDYMAKPFEPRELVARIETIMRRSQHRRTPGRPSGRLFVEPLARNRNIHISFPMRQSVSDCQPWCG